MAAVVLDEQSLGFSTELVRGIEYCLIFVELREKPLSSCHCCDCAGRLLHEPNPEAVFEAAHELTHARWRKPELLCRSREAAPTPP
jgi:hypothetical protein